MAKVQLEELLAGLVQEWKARAVGLRRGEDWASGGYSAGWVQGAATAYVDCSDQLGYILPREEVEEQRGNAGTTR